MILGECRTLSPPKVCAVAEQKNNVTNEYFASQSRYSIDGVMSF